LHYLSILKNRVGQSKLNLNYPRSKSIMSLASITRRVVATFSTLLPANSTTGSKRELIALTIAGLMLLQPMVLMAQRGRVALGPNSASTTMPEKGKAKPNAPAPSAPFTSGNLVVYRVGDGSAGLTANATAVFLDEYATVAGPVVQSIAMPTTASGSNKRLTASGTATTEGFITRSADSTYLVMPGYDAALGTGTITTSTSATINRVIGRVNGSGTIDTSTALTDAISGGNPRGAASTNGTDLWISGTSSGGGIRYAALGGTTSTSLTTSPTNIRATAVFNNQLYISSASGTFLGVATVGSGTPTTSPQTTTLLPGFPTSGTHSSYQFGFANASTLYVADDGSAANGGGIQKWTLSGGTWSLAYTLLNTGAATTAVRGLTVDGSGANPVIYATTAVASANSLIKVIDTGAGSTATTLATASANTAFRGVAFAPGDAAPSVSSTTPANSATGVALNSDISITFSEAVNLDATPVTVSCATSGSHTYTVGTSDNLTFTVNPDSDFVNGEVCTVTVDDVKVHDQDANDPPDNMAADYVFSFTTVPATPTLNIGDVTQAEGDAGTTNFNFNVSLTAPAGGGGVTFTVNTADGTTNPANAGSDYVQITNGAGSITSGNTSTTVTVTVNGDTTPEANETFFVNISNITGAIAGDTQGLGTITNDDVSLTAIHTIQGNGSTSPLVGNSVTTRGIVTGIKSGSSGGFFIQEPDASVDADPNTSEGVFVFTGSTPPAAAVVGNYVQVSGTVQEFVFASDPNSPPVTEISGTITASVLTTGNTLPAAHTLTAAETTAPSGTTNPLDSMEEFEFMRVTVPSLTVVGPTDGTINEPNATVSGDDVFYGVVTGVARPFREAGVNVSDATALGLAGTIPRFDENPERIRVDSDGQPGTTAVDVPADTVLTNVTGPLDYSFRTYTILPDTTISLPALPGSVPAPTPTANEVTVASFNMERFFDTNNDPNTSDPVLTGTAFNKRLDKASRIIRTVQRYPDVIGVQEMENLSTLQAVAAKVNSDAQTIDLLPNPNYVAYLVEGNDIGGIDVGFLVKESRLTTVDVTQIELAGCDHVTPTTCYNYTNPNDGSLDILNDRPPLVLRATAPRPGGGTFAFTVIVNHMRSLNSIDDETPQGTGTVGTRVRMKRQKGAEFLANYIQSRQTADPTERIITLGDLNAFRVNDGYADVIGTILGTPSADNQTLVPGDGADLVNPNLTDLIDTLTAAQQYSYTFDGNAQTLDHIIVDQPALAVTNRFAYARDDADFPVKNYELANELRLSDHDQPIVYLSLLPPATSGQLLISEFRNSGPNGVNDEFIEIYNNTNSAHTVQSSDVSAGYGVVAQDNILRCTIPNGTVIPARGHYLCVNSAGYSLGNYPAGVGTTATGDATYTADIPDNNGVALFNSAATFSAATRLDSVGFTSTPVGVFKEGTGLVTLSGSTLQYSYLRDLCGKGGSATISGPCPSAGLPLDTNNNATDFVFLDTGGTVTPAGQRLGAPGPENLSSPIQRNSLFAGLLLDGSVSSSSAPNRVRDFTADSANNSTFGTLEVRRRFVNNTGSSVTRLRFRIVDMTTFPVPGGYADLRARTSSLVVVSGINDAGTCLASNGVATIPCTVNVQGTTLETPPSQPFGGGLNSTMSVTLGTPLAPGASVNVRFLLGIQQTGTFRFFINVEALP
jgi:predicted extracellular nuclease